MAQTINVNTTPGQFMPTLYYSQGDIGREFEIVLASSDGWSIPAGATVEMVATKPSGFGFTVSGTLSDNTATFVTTETMTNEWGRFPAEVRISSSGDVIGTANFYLSGERDPHPEETIDGDAEEIIPELTLLVERVEAAASSVLDMTVVANTLPAGSDATYSYDEETNTATFGIPKGADGSLASGVLAPTYSSSSTYAVGDYVYYSGNLYRCTTAITTAEAWTSGHWTQVAIAPEVSDVKSDLNDRAKTSMMQKCDIVTIPASANKWDDSTAQVGYLHKNGTVYTGGSYDNYRYNSIGAVSPGDVITSWKYKNNAASAQPMQMVIAYDSNGDVISASGDSSVSSYTVPSGVASIKCTFSASQLAENVMVLINADGTPTKYIPYYPENSYYVAGDGFIPEITAKDCNFMFYSKNLLDESKVTDGYYVNQTTGNLESNSAHSVSDWIPVEAGEKYTFSMALSRSLRYCFYNSSKTYISGVATAEITSLSLTVEAPAGAAYIRFSTTSFYTALIQFEKGSVATKYSRYGTAYVLPQYAPSDASDLVINLPSKIYALVGYELNVYFENLVENWDAFDWDVSCTKGIQLERGFRITPTLSDVGTYTLLILAKQGDVEASATTTLVVTSSSAGSGTTDKVLILGDSTTANGIAVTKLNENFSDDVMSIETIGTRGTAPNNHEGRSGWTFSDYFTRAADPAYPSILNPFYNPVSETFDAGYYFTNSGVSVPDWFFINLGINDMFGYTTDSALETAIGTVKGLCDDMIDSILTAEPTIKIGLCLTIPPNHSQDAFGKAYGTSQTRDRYKRNNTKWVEALIAEYDGREADGIYLIPIYTNLDTVWNMGMESIPVNARNSTTYESPIGNGGVHPADSGYWQIADVYTAFLKAQA